jgi:hypothetical protein
MPRDLPYECERVDLLCPADQGRCECEHDSHLEGGLTPAGMMPHNYGATFPSEYLTKLGLEYGFGAGVHVCKDCLHDCLRGLGKKH